MFSCIFARDYQTGGFGYNDTIPWNEPDDLKMFKKITTDNYYGEMNNLIMGRNTFKSVKKIKTRRLFIVTSQSKQFLSDKNAKNIFIVKSLDDALIICSSFKNSKSFVIGGPRLLKEAFSHRLLGTIYLSEVKYPDLRYDTFFFKLPPFEFFVKYRKIVSDTLSFYRFDRRAKSDEYSYISLLKNVLENGNEQKDRTNIGTISLFGPQVEFDLQKGFPLLTTKKVFLRGIVEELLFFLRGQTNVKILQDKNIHIWDKNVENSKFINGESGKMYGFQMRHFGGNFTPNKEHTGGFDQISYIINELKTNPFSRRIFMSFWNPLDMPEQCLPCCHVSSQYYVRYKDGEKILDCKVYLRSNDLFLGAPFNIASYALLVHMFSKICGMKVGMLYYTIGDAHVYKNHISQVKEQIDRCVKNSPQLVIKRVPDKIEDFCFEDFEIKNYSPHPTILADMAV
jgi:thymidylate synthase/dihydrofolate reductase